MIDKLLIATENSFNSFFIAVSDQCYPCLMNSLNWLKSVVSIGGYSCIELAASIFIYYFVQIERDMRLILFILLLRKCYIIVEVLLLFHLFCLCRKIRMKMRLLISKLRLSTTPSMISSPVRSKISGLFRVRSNRFLCTYSEDQSSR